MKIQASLLGNFVEVKDRGNHERKLTIKCKVQLFCVRNFDIQKKLFKPWLKIVPLYIDSHIKKNLVFCMNEQKTKGNKDFKFCLAYNCEEL